MLVPDSHPILSCAEAKAWEAQLLRSEAAEWSAMTRAGSALAQAVLQEFRELGGLPETARVLVLAGKGHNGGDALLAAQALLAARPSARVDLVLAFGEAALRPLAGRALEELRRAGAARVTAVDLPALKHESASYDVCLDGVFGFQFRPPIDEPVAELLAWVNSHPRIRLRAAVDLPSGLGDEGNAKTVFRADFTFATGIVKSPLIAAGNATWVGRPRYLDLGFFADSRPERAGPATAVLTPTSLRPLAALRPPQADKRTYGHLLVVGGSMHYPGAVLMSVQAALRSGAGLLTACVPAALVPEYAARFPEAMWSGFSPGSTGGLTAEALPLLREKAARASAILIGPGLGADHATIAAVVDFVRAATVPVLLDADAIRPEVIAAVSAARLVATPHAGEWQRVQATWPAEAVLVLKGAPTRVRHRDATYYSFCGGPVLARGGSGDLLAGLIGGLLAQAPDDLLLAAARGVVWHGLAADLLAREKGQVAVQTTQLLEFLQPALHCADHGPS